MLSVVLLTGCLNSAELSYGIQYVYWNGNDYNTDSEYYRDYGVTLDIDNFYMHRVSASGTYRGMNLGCVYIQQFVDFGSDLNDDIGDRIVGYIGKYLGHKVILRAKGEYGNLNGEYEYIEYNRGVNGSTDPEVIDSGSFSNKYLSISFEAVFDLTEKYGHPCSVYTGLSYKRYGLPSLHTVEEKSFTSNKVVAYEYDPDYVIQGLNVVLGGEVSGNTRFCAFGNGNLGLGVGRAKIGDAALESLREQSRQNTTIFGEDPEFEDDEWVGFGQGEAEAGVLYRFTDYFKMMAGFRVAFVGGGQRFDDDDITGRHLNLSRFDFYYGPTLTVVGTF